jgi:hypothetical protein
MKIWTWLFGKDEYLNGEHIAHEPSLFQRLKRPDPICYEVILIVEFIGEKR